MFKKIKAIFADIKAALEQREFDRWRFDTENKILSEGIVGNEWKLKDLDRHTAKRTGYFFPLFLDDKEYAILVCKCVMNDTFYSLEARIGAKAYLKTMGVKI